MTVAISLVVQRSVSYSQVIAPRRRRRGSCRCCSAVNFGGRPAPEDHRTVRTPGPAGHLRDGCARLQQINSAPSPPFQLLGASLWSHFLRLSREASGVYYLRTDRRNANRALAEPERDPVLGLLGHGHD